VHAPAGAAWWIQERLTPSQPTVDAQVTEAWLDPELHLISGTYRRSNSSGFLAATYAVGADGLVSLDHTTPEYENHLEPEGRGPTLGTTAGLVLWLRHLGAGADGRTAMDFDPDPSPGDPYLATLHVESHGRVAWRRGEERVLLDTLSVTRGQRTLRFAFAPGGLLQAFEVEGLGLNVTLGDGPALALDDAQGLAQSTRDRAAEAARTMRRRLPLPTRPYRFEGDMTLDGATIGTVLLEATPVSHEGQPAWDVLEITERKGGEAVVRSELAVRLSEDLTVLRGERRFTSPSGASRSSFHRTATTMRITHEEDGATPVTLDGVVRPDSVMGTLAVLLLVREADLGTGPAHWVLPGFDPRFARTPKAGSGAVATGEADLTVDVSAVEDGRRRVRVRSRLGFETIYVVDAASGLLTSAEGVLPRSGIVARGQGGPEPDWYDAVEGIPANAHQAFIRFGRGYHLPRRDLLEVAFDWPALHRHEIAAGLWAADTPLDTVREAWIEEFFSRSKHRTEGDCDDLLMQIFLTMSVIEEADGSVTFATLPVYGGHRYRIADCGDAGWCIVRVD
jgi:hypothetical protein